MDVNRVHLRVPIASVGDILTWGQSQVQRVADAAVPMLLRVGFRIEDDTYLTALQAAGARTDQTTNTVRFTEDQILETARQMATSSPAHPRPVIAYDTRDIRVGLGGGANNSFDWESRKAVASRSEHLRNVAHLAVGHPNVVSIAPPVQVKDVPLALEPVMSFALLIRNTPREMSDVSPYIPTQPAHVKWLKCLGEALADRRGGSYWMHNQEYVTSPLMLSSRALDTIEARVQHGCDAIACGSMGHRRTLGAGHYRGRRGRGDSRDSRSADCRALALAPSEAVGDCGQRLRRHGHHPRLLREPSGAAPELRLRRAFPARLWVRYQRTHMLPRCQRAGNAGLL